MAFDFPASPTDGQKYPASPIVTYTWDGEKWTTAAANASAPVLRGHLAGLTLSTAGASTTFNIAPGTATDSNNVATISLTSLYSKTTAAWVVGSGNGALDTGTITASSWYHVYLIKRVDTGVVDVLISKTTTPSSGPSVMPSNYTLFRRIGSMLTNASSQWTKFFQDGDVFTWDVMVTEVSVSPGAATPVIATLAGAPLGVRVRAFGPCWIGSNATGGGLLITAVEQTATTPVPPACHITTVNALNYRCAGWWSVYTSLTNTIRYQISARDASTTINILLVGYEDTRGRND